MTTLVNGVRQQASTGFPRDAGRILLVGELAQEDHPLVDLHMGAPFASARIPRHTSVPRRAPTLGRLILPVLAGGENPQIAPPIVQRVAVDVVALSKVTALEAKQCTVQTHSVPAITDMLSAASVAEATTGVPAPAPLRDPRGIVSVNERMAANGTVFSEEGDTNGILKAHHGHLRGVTPRDVCRIAGASSCLHFTTPYQRAKG